MCSFLEPRKWTGTDLSPSDSETVLKNTLTGQAKLKVCRLLFLLIKRVKKTRLSEKDEMSVDSTAVGPIRCSCVVSIDMVKLAIMYFTNSMGSADTSLR